MTALVDRFRALPRADREALYAELGDALRDIEWDWEGTWARPDQVVTVEELRRFPLIVFTGIRGCGKTQAAVSLFNREILAGRATRPRIVAATDYDVDKTVVHGLSGIMVSLPPGDRPRWMGAEGAAGVLRYPNAVDVLCFSAKAPEQLVGSAGDLDLYDDPAKWGASTERVWQHARTSCRIGNMTGLVATTRRGTLVLRKLLALGEEHGVLVRRPPTLDANASNLPGKYFQQVVTELEALGGEDFVRQELEDEDVSARSPFADLNFDAPPIRVVEVLRHELVEVVVAVDPAEGKGGDHDEWGIGAAGRRSDRHVFAIEDASGSYDDDEAGAKALALCEAWGANLIVAESNRGLARVRSVLLAAYYRREAEAALRGQGRPRPLPELVGVTAKEGKVLRAGPLRPLYLQGLLHHTAGLRLLEKQARAWDPDAPRRPRVDDRIDWLVHAVHHLADLGSVAVDPREQLDGLAERVRGVHARADAARVPVAAGDLQRFHGLSADDPRSTDHNSARAGTWGIGGGRRLL